MSVYLTKGWVCLSRVSAGWMCSVSAPPPAAQSSSPASKPEPTPSHPRSSSSTNSSSFRSSNCKTGLSQNQDNNHISLKFTSKSFSENLDSVVKSFGWWWRILTLSPLRSSSESGTPRPHSSSTTSGRLSYLQRQKVRARFVATTN